MAGFQTHITVSSVAGLAYAWYGHDVLHLGWPTCAVGGGLCAISGMFPDLDSDSGVPARETISFAAAVVPMLLFNRLHQSGWSVEQFILAGAPLYLFIRYGLGTILKLWTIHRGMFHSIPAMLIAGMLAYLICDSGPSNIRWFKAGGVMLGFFSHLLLDEIWSVEVKALGPRVKSSFGTALKLFGNNAAANMMCYGCLILVGIGVLQDNAMQQTQLAKRPASRTAVPLSSTTPTISDDGVFTPPPVRAAPAKRPRFQARTHRFDTDQE